MMKHILIAFLLSLSTIVWADTEYTIDRVVQFDGFRNLEIPDAEGFAYVEDNGPFTEMLSIQIEVTACDGLLASPLPLCDPISITLAGETIGYENNGGTYFLETGEAVTIIRRGNRATGDPAMIVFIDGMVMIFKEQEESPVAVNWGWRPGPGDLWHD